MALVSISHHDHLKQRQNLLKLFDNQELCDVTFIVGEERKEIKTHRLLFASISPVFKAMLYGNMRESEPNSEIEIIDVNPNAFASVLKFAYCNDPMLSAHNIILIKQICDKYQISLLSELCDPYFNACIDSKNICLLLNQVLDAKLLLYVNIIRQKLSQIGSMASQIVKSKGFLEMNVNSMIIFLQSDSLNIKEEDLWEAVLEWTNYKTCTSNNNSHGNNDFDIIEPAKKKQKLNNGSSKRKNNDGRLDLLKSVCPFIRFGLMNGQYFVKKVKPLNCLSMEDIANIVCYIQCNDEKCGNFSIKPRAHIKALPPKELPLTFTLRMSSKFVGVPNNYANLITSNLNQGCGTQKTQNPWIKASFNQVMNIKKIEIAAASKQMTGKWGTSFINGGVIQYKDKGKWVSLIRLTEIQENVIHQFNVNVQTKALRVYYPTIATGRACFVGIGCWRIYGFSL